MSTHFALTMNQVHAGSPLWCPICNPSTCPTCGSDDPKVYLEPLNPVARELGLKCSDGTFHQSDTQSEEGP